MIAAEARDDLLLRRSPAQVVVVADQLDVGVVGIRARAAEKDPGEVAGASLLAEQREDAIGEADDRLARGRAEDVVIVEVLDRLLRRFGDLGPAVADVDAPETGAAVDQLAPLVVLDAHTPAALDDQRPVAHVCGDRGERMEQALPVHLLERVVRFLLEHSLPPLGPATAVEPSGDARSQSQAGRGGQSPERPTRPMPVNPASTISARPIRTCSAAWRSLRPRQPRHCVVALTANPGRKLAAGQPLIGYRTRAFRDQAARTTTGDPLGGWIADTTPSAAVRPPHHSAAARPDKKARGTSAHYRTRAVRRPCHRLMELAKTIWQVDGDARPSASCRHSEAHRINRRSIFCIPHSKMKRLHSCILPAAPN